MRFQQKNLSQFQILNQMNNPPEANPQACHLEYHLRFQREKMSQFHILNYVTMSVDIPQPSHMTFHQRSLKVDTPQACNHHSFLRSHWRSLYHLQLMLPVFIQVRISRVYHHHSLLITHWRKLSQFQLLPPVILPIIITQV